MTDHIECDGCGRSFVTEDAAGMLAAIKGPCPTCGGRFHLASEALHAPSSAPAAERPSR